MRTAAISGLPPERAELDVVDVLGDRRVVAAHRAVGIAPHRHLVECRAERVERAQPPCERVATVEDQLQRLARLQRADDAGQDSEDASLGAARRQLGRLGEQAAVAGPGPGGEHRDLPRSGRSNRARPESRARSTRRSRGSESGSCRAVDDHVHPSPRIDQHSRRSAAPRTVEASTSGLSASIVRFAECTFGSPRRSVEWMI